jgi:hypothetical protein
MAEMRKEEKRGRFGSMEPLARESFVKEVTEGSKERAPGEEEDGEEEEGSKGRRLKGTGVVVFLYKDSCVAVLSPCCSSLVFDIDPWIPFATSHAARRTVRGPGFGWVPK